jgi:hypothetical protein
MAKTTTAAKPTETIDNETGEVVSLPVASQEFGAGLKYEVVKQVTVPILSWPEGASYTFLIESGIVIGKVISEKRGGDPDKKPAKLMRVRSAGGQLRQIVVGAVLEGELTENYPDGKYVGKWFHATKFAPNRARKQRYATYEITEIKDPR